MAPREDLTGRTFGKWRVLEYVGDRKYSCECECGTIKEVHEYSLKSGKSTSCGRCGIKAKPDKFALGTKFGEWEIVGAVDKKTYKVLCRCSCGKEREVNIYTLLSGKSTGCGHTMNQDRVQDLSGRKFGKLTVLRYLGNQYWECECECGSLAVKHRTHLLDGRAVQCKACSGKAPEDLSNMTFGKLHPIKYIGSKSWLCKCDCGNTKIVASMNLKNHSTVSCGCLLYNPSKEELLSKIKEYQDRFNDLPTISDLAGFCNVGYASMGYHLRKFGINTLKKFGSKYETELFNFVSTLTDCTILRNDRTVIAPSELDIYIPEKKLAIEFNGTYWHDSEHKKESYHLIKSVDCRKLGIRLIHVFEYEWVNEDTQDKIKELLRAAICDNLNRVYARQTEVTLVNDRDAKEFLENNHLQGYLPTYVNLGLQYNNELIAVLSLGKPRFDREYDLEIIRFAYKAGTIVVGGLDKIWAYVLKQYNPNSVISYCDLSKFDGHSYIKLGMRISRITSPGYCWVSDDNRTILSRYQTTKSKLVESGLGDLESSEDEIMLNMGMHKMYNSGNLKLVWSRL